MSLCRRNLALGLAPLVCAAALAQTSAETGRLLEQGKYAEALPLLQQAARQNPGDASLQFNLGLALFRLNRLEDALVPLSKAAGDPKLSDDAGYLQGVALFQLGRWAESARKLESLRRHQRHGETALYMLVEAYRRTKEPDKTKQAFLDLASRYPESAYLNRLMGIAYESEGNFLKALEEFQQALTKNPQMPEIHFAIGFIHWKQQRFEDAAPYFERELSIQPCFAQAHYYLGEIYRKRGQMDKAAAGYRKAFECDSGYAGAYLGLGTLLEQQGQIEEAIAMYREYVRREPRQTDGRYRLARALQKAGRSEEAEAEFRAVKELMESRR